MRHQDAIAMHLDHLDFLNSSPRTVGNHRSTLNAFARYLTSVGIEHVTAVTPSVMRRYRSHLFQARANGKPLALNTQIQKLSNINRFFQTLVERGVVLINVAERLPLPKPAERLPRRLPTAKAVERLLKAMPVRTPKQFRDRIAMEVLYATGMRQAELSRLRQTDVDLKRGELAVIGKGLKDRVLPLSRRCTDALTEYLAHVRPLLPKSDILLPTRSGRRLDVRTLLDIVAKAAKKAGIRQKLTTHTFRHVLATELLRNGANLRSIQEYLGHKTVETTTIYAKVLGKDLKAVHSKTHPGEQRKRHG